MKVVHHGIIYIISIIWIANGLLGKVLGLMSKHQQIVASIFGQANSQTYTLLIGVIEIALGVWMISRFKPRLNAITQLMIGAVMITIESFTVPTELLIGGRWNALIAALFLLLICWNEFVLGKKVRAIRNLQ